MAKKYIYNDYLKNISTKYSNLIGEISANYNFDLGMEFELVICAILRKILPNKYGICRGFLVAENGDDKEGDDIIIYDQIRFPQIRLFDENDFAHKQEVPIEAAYAYIEAKNSLIQGVDKKDKPYSFKKALTQVSNVKKLVSKRESIQINNAFNPYISIDIKKTSGRPNWPTNINPFFTAIMSPSVKTKKSEEINDPKKIGKELMGAYDDEFSADLIVAGKDVCYLPKIDNTYFSPFYIEEKSILSNCVVKQNAFALGMCSLLYALDTICLGIMPWPRIIEDGLNSRTKIKK